MFITKKHIPRRTFLRGAGVALALPLLDSMLPAQTPLRETAANPRSHFTGIFVPHGMAPGYWVPSGEGADFEFKTEVADSSKMIMAPLAPFRDQVVILSGMWSRSAEPPPGTTGADHWVASAFMSANQPRKTAGSDIWNGTTVDQRIAEKIGQQTLLPSLQLAVEDPGSNSANCGEGYSCSYTNSISWSAPSKPLPMEINPQTVFLRLFGDGSTPAERAAGRAESRSILDSITESVNALNRKLGPSDRQRFEEYLTDVREIERRLDIAAKASTDAPAQDVPAGVPDDFDQHIKLQFDLNVLAFQADITRVSSILFARDLTGKVYTFADGTRSVGFHIGSHHQEIPANIANYAKLNRYHVSCLAYYIEKLKSTPDGDGNLLDHSLILYGSNMGNSNQHQHYDVPHILVGGAGGKLKGNRHITFDRKTWRSGSLLLRVLDMYGIHRDSQGDSDVKDGLNGDKYIGPLPKL
jgi:hypothetical protein